MVEVSSSEWDFEVLDTTEFLQKFSEIAQIEYAKFGLAGYIAVVAKDPRGMFHTVALGVNEESGRKGWGAGVSEPSERAIATLTGKQTRVRSNVIFINETHVICAISDDGKGYPEKNDERDAQIIQNVLIEMCGE